MKPDSAQVKYQQADKLFRENQFAAALEILDELDQAFPKTKNIMLLKAFCLAYLYRAQEAIRVCDRILSRFNCPEAHDLKIRLVRNDGLPVMPGRDSGPPRKIDSSSKSQSGGSVFSRIGDAFFTMIILMASLLIIAVSIHYILYG
ncbi:MAG TPA: tetratricopeptide repeat protein [Candidatus Hydrogenedentes bacterium]|mgnify:CR=1 FL=1|nr:tetratricopeptide repeat protein [Candidatus Hydrogenedentota bacterium]